MTLIILATLSVGIMAASLIRITQQRVITSGIDAYETHFPLFAKRTAAQEITLEGALIGAGAIFVDMRRAEQLVDITVRLREKETNALLEETAIPANNIKDDEFAIAYLSQPVLTKKKTVILEFSAMNATSRNPIGVRFHTDEVYQSGQRYENEQPVPGDFAILLLERVTLGRYLKTTVLQNKSMLTYFGITLGTSAIIALLALKTGWSSYPPHIQRRIEITVIILIVCIAITARLTWLPLLYGVSGGDPYNYLFITQKMSNLENPFAGTKRLPGYPLLLLPSFLSAQLDDIRVMRILSITSAGAALALLALLARSLRLPWTVQLVAPVILALQKDFWWVSLRPEPYTFYTALLLATLILFFHLHKRWAQIVFSLTLGLAAMTRQEGFVLAIVLGFCTVITYRKKLWLTGYSYAFAPAFLLIIPFFINNTLLYGNPLYTPYFEGERLQIVDSWEAFKDNLGGTWGVIGTMWRPVWDRLHRIPFSEPLFAASVIGTLIWWAASAKSTLPTTWRGKAVIAGVSLALLTATVWLVTTDKPLFAESIMTITAAVLFVSTIPFLITTGWRGSVVWLVLATQVLIATWFHPFAKHYQQSYPLLVLLVTTTVIALPPLNTTVRKKLRFTDYELQITNYAAILAPLILVAIILVSQRTTIIDEHNHDTALDHVVYEATTIARRLPGPHGFDQGYLPARLYFEDRAFYFSGDENEPQEKQRAWLAQHNIRTLIVTNANPAFLEPEPNWQQVFSHTAEGNDERIYESLVYVLPERIE